MVPGTLRWARGLDAEDAHGVPGAPGAALAPGLRLRVMDLAPLWAAYRARYLLPMSAGPDRPLSAEPADIADLPLTRRPEDPRTRGRRGMRNGRPPGRRGGVRPGR
ncbi:hypothetical protein [Streptomyces cellulosae]|uniref:Uncharacterized protein n=1 Tax=Streptomyces cellulosae TaxID=1968 RepID=A0ABW7YH00_STRCE